ncbi:MAG: sodium-dependent transporter, partial [Kiritimatiellae bacterium]|nr:sodium-dependent transporter [Kiritimatiellia bacterium]
MSEKRETLATSLGFLLVSAGCAVGLGNVWRFPYIVGQNGGALFVLLYIVFLLIFGLPMLTAEFAVGRASQRSVAASYDVLVAKPGIFKPISKLQIAANWMLMMYYMTVAGWMLAYPFALLTGMWDFSDAEDFFEAFVGSASSQLIWTFLVALIGFGVFALGLKKGVESVTKKMMTALFILLIGLCIYAITLPNAERGLAFYLKPSFEILKDRSIMQIIFDALGQSFFTLSLGIGSMSIFGSYTSRKYSLAGESAKIIGIDISVAFLAGLVIFPACFAYDVSPNQGPALIFMTLPKVFAQMPGGVWIGSAFFIFLALAALTTVIAVIENIVAMKMETAQCTRMRAIASTAPLLLVLAIPCALGFNILKTIEPLGPGSNILDLEDFFVSNIALPLGALAFLIFCVSKRYWGWDNFLKEANEGCGLKLSNALRTYMTYILPTILL